MPDGVGLLRAGHVDLLALEHVLAAVERVDPGDALDQGALAGAVVADERGDRPSRTSRSTSRSTSTAPKLLVTPRRLRIGWSPLVGPAAGAGVVMVMEILAG
jgi:hypothetical protein